MNYDIEDRINLIYDFLYNPNSKNKFIIEKIILGKIGLEDIKYPLNDNPNNFYNDIKSEIIDGKYKLLSFDQNNNQIILKKYSDNFSTNIKISFYINKKIIDKIETPINNDSLFSYLLSQLVLNKKTSHILLPIINIDLHFSDIETIINSDYHYDIIKKKVNNSDISNICCLQIRENFFKSVNLDEYLKKYNCSYKRLFFQLIHTLAIIQQEYTHFRHNDLTIKNILIYHKKEDNNYTEYIIKDKVFYLPNIDFDIKISNFEKSIIPKYYGIFNSKDPNIKFADKVNPYYDLYIFFNDLLSNIDINKSCDKETIDFINKYYPNDIRNKKDYNNVIVALPIDILNDKYFYEYNNKETKQYLGKIRTILEDDNLSILGEQNKLISNYNIMSGKNNLINHRFIRDELDTDTEKLKRINQKGGSDKIYTNPYKVEKNTPFLTNEQRSLHKKRVAENPPREPPVILEQKLYDTSQKPASKPAIPPTHIPIVGYGEEAKIATNLLPYSHLMNQAPVQKVYNISLSNPLGNYTTLSQVYEDMLPSDTHTYSFLTLYERMHIINFLRNMIIQNNDGEEMTISSGKHSLLSFIKILDPNPYTINKNPYTDLPRNFLLYRSAYPIRFDEKTKMINIAKSSTGLNIRIYMLTIGELKCRGINKAINEDRFDLWREVKYYSWVREELLKKKVSPNFVAPIFYNIDSKSKINWDKLQSIKYEKDPTYLSQIIDNQNKLNNIHNLAKNTLFASLLPKHLIKSTPVKTELEDITMNSGKSLVLVTEAPNSSLMQWAGAVYESYGSVKKMISTGFHTHDVWKCIIFQLVYIFSILEKAELYFNDISIENNFYIKDIFTDENAIGSWIYKIDNVDYYIPNYGYILMFDSKYTDINIDDRIIKKDVSNDMKYKINSPMYSYNHVDKSFIKNYIKTQFKHIVNPDNFRYIFKAKGCHSLDENTLDLLKRLFNSTADNIKDNLHDEYFASFLHNRIGTPLLKSEYDIMQKLIHNKPKFTKGKLMPYQKRFDEYIWVMYLGNDKENELKHIVMLKNDNIYTKESVFGSSLMNYSDIERINFNVDRKFRYDDSYIYETYIFDNLN